jgi:Zn-dependent peptidase ImmA (M78 family)
MTAMDEAVAVWRAREFVRKVRPSTVPVPVERYAAEINAEVRVASDCEPGEAGYSFETGGKRIICVNATERPTRQRFTVCHEIGHAVLELPSEHTASSESSYARRPLNEIWCDVFAAELLLPFDLFKPRVTRSEMGLEAISTLANEFDASFAATGSRFAAVADIPCAFVLAEAGAVRYASRSKALRDAYGMIPAGTKIPRGSLSERAREGVASDGAEEFDADRWLARWSRGGVLLEEARYLQDWDQILTLLWFEDEDVPETHSDESDRRDEEAALGELDGVLPWPGSRRRK